MLIEKNTMQERDLLKEIQEVTKKSNIKLFILSAHDAAPIVKNNMFSF